MAGLGRGLQDRADRIVPTGAGPERAERAEQHASVAFGARPALATQEQALGTVERLVASGPRPTSWRLHVRTLRLRRGGGVQSIGPRRTTAGEEVTHGSPIRNPVPRATSHAIQAAPPPAGRHRAGDGRRDSRTR